MLHKDNERVQQIRTHKKKQFSGSENWEAVREQKKWMGSSVLRLLDMIGKVFRNLRLVLQHMLSVRKLHVSLPRYLHLWHCLLHRFLGGVEPDALSPPGSKPFCPPHHSPAVALHHGRKKEVEKKIIICIIFLPF